MFPGDLDYFPVPDKNTAGIIIFHQVSLSVIKYLEDGKCGVGHLPDLTDGQRLHDGFDALFQKWRRLKNIVPRILAVRVERMLAFYPAPHSVRQDHYIGILRF